MRRSAVQIALFPVMPTGRAVRFFDFAEFAENQVSVVDVNRYRFTYKSGSHPNRRSRHRRSGVSKSLRRQQLLERIERISFGCRLVLAPSKHAWKADRYARFVARGLLNSLEAQLEY
jgi:hypothetical protein